MNQGGIMQSTGRRTIAPEERLGYNHLRLVEALLWQNNISPLCLMNIIGSITHTGSGMEVGIQRHWLSQLHMPWWRLKHTSQNVSIYSCQSLLYPEIPIYAGFRIHSEATEFQSTKKFTLPLVVNISKNWFIKSAFITALLKKQMVGD